MSRVCLHVVVPVLESLKFHNEGILDAILCDKISLCNMRKPLDPTYLQPFRRVIFPSKERLDIRLLMLRVQTVVLQGHHPGISLFKISTHVSLLTIVVRVGITSLTASGVASALNWTWTMCLIDMIVERALNGVEGVVEDEEFAMGIAGDHSRRVRPLISSRYRK